MHTSCDESETLLQVGDEPLELTERDVLGPPALLAHEMVMLGMVAQVEHGRPMTQMDMMEPPHRLQRVDRPVHRRLVDGDPGDLLGTTVQLGCGEVLVVRRRDHLTDRTTRCGHPQAGAAEILDEGDSRELRH
jgi:hypothetical protein